MTSRTVTKKIQWKRQGSALGTSSGTVVGLWWPINLLAPMWLRARRVAMHELTHQKQALLKDIGKQDPNFDDGTGHHPAAHKCLMVAEKDFWTSTSIEHALVSEAETQMFLLIGKITLNAQ